MNSLLTGLAIPTALSATSAAARTVQTAAKPFAATLHSAIELLPGGGTVADPADSAASNAALGNATVENNSPLALLGDRGIDLAEIRVRADSLRDDLEQRLRQAFAEVGVGADVEVRLRVNPKDGAVEVLGNHPQRVAIEALLASDAALSSDFRRLQSMNQLLQAADESRRFANAYEQNPRQAVTDYRQLFHNRGEAVLKLSPSGAETRLDF